MFLCIQLYRLTFPYKLSLICVCGSAFLCVLTDLPIQAFEPQFDLLALGIGPVRKDVDDGLLISTYIGRTCVK